MKKIAWESWNQKEIEFIESISPSNDLPLSEDENDQEQVPSLVPLSPEILNIPPQIIHTPFGVVPYDSMLKPSDRWECWIGYTDFDLTHGMQDKIKTIDGVEALKIISRYTLCVGIGKMFNYSKVKKDIENAICK